MKVELAPLAPRGVTERPPGAKGDILAVLREQTRTEHETVEQTLGLMSDTLSAASYRRTIERFHGFWQPMEARLRAAPGLAEIGLDLTTREKTPLLALDLCALGVDAEADARLCDDLPRVESTAAALGCLYVIEGASLGGQIISRHLRARLDITKDTGGLFFHGYGERTGEMWRAFGAAVRAFAATPAQQAEMVASAVATFRLLRAWCERPGSLSPIQAVTL